MSSRFTSALQRVSSSGVAAPEVLRDVLLRAPPTTISTLRNGVRVACETAPCASVTTVGLWIENGSRFEAPHLGGTAQVLQRCGFLGTTNQSGEEIKSAVAELGGCINAKVNRDHTFISLTVLKHDLNKCVGFLADVVRNARLADADVATAKKLVENAYKKSAGTEKAAMDYVFRSAFDCSEPGLGNGVFGAESGLEKMSANDLNEFRSKTLKSRRIVLVASGGVTHTELEKAAQTCLGDMAAEQITGIAPPVCRYVGGENRITITNASRTCAAWGFQVCPSSCADVLPLSLACAVGRTTGMKLPIRSSMDLMNDAARVSVKKNCTLVTRPFLHTFKDTGLCGGLVTTLAGVQGEDLSAAVAEELKQHVAQWRSLACNIVADGDLRQAKGYLKHQFLSVRDAQDDSAQDIGTQVLRIGRRVPLAEMFDRIDEISPSVLRQVIHQYFIRHRPAFSYVGKPDVFPRYEQAKRWTNKYWN